MVTSAQRMEQNSVKRYIMVLLFWIVTLAIDEPIIVRVCFLDHFSQVLLCHPVLHDLPQLLCGQETILVLVKGAGKGRKDTGLYQYIRT